MLGEGGVLQPGRGSFQVNVNCPERAKNINKNQRAEREGGGGGNTQKNDWGIESQDSGA